MQTSCGAMQLSRTLKTPVSRPLAALPTIGLRPIPTPHGCSVSALPWRKHRQDPEDPDTKAALRPLTAQDKAEIQQAQQANQERIDALGIQPVYEAYEDFCDARIELTFTAVGFYIVLTVLWFAARSQPPLETRQHSEVVLSLIVNTGVVLWNSYDALVATSAFASRHSTLKRMFRGRCRTLCESHTSQELAAEFCKLKGAKLDLSKLW